MSNEVAMAELLQLLVTPRDVRQPADRFYCSRLRCAGVTGRECVRRQKLGDSVTKDSWRGQGVKVEGSCQTALCADGALIRSRLDPAAPALVQLNHWKTIRLRQDAPKGRRALDNADRPVRGR